MLHSSIPSEGATPLTPTQLLEAQVRLLTEIKQAHELEFGQLRQQNEQLQRLLKTIVDLRGATAWEPIPVQVENFNMPFMAVVGFVVKASLASIPAAIVIGALWFGMFFVLSTVLGLGLTLPR